MVVEVVKNPAYSLFLDDERDPPGKNPPSGLWVVVRSYASAVHFVTEHGAPRFISFDHDLGDGETGFDFAKWLTDADMDGAIRLPQDFDFVVHSQNPIGAKNIQSLLSSYLDFRRKPQHDR